MTLARHFYAILGLATILTTISVSSTHMRGAAAPGSGVQNVLVTNTSAQPVPTNVIGIPAVHIASGQSVGVSGAVSVNASQSGTWNVGISGTPSVSATISGTPNVNVSSLPAVQFGDGANVAINNTSTNPVSVRETGPAGRQFVSVFHLMVIPAGAYGFGENIYLVPQGKQLLVKDVFIKADLPHGQTCVDAFFDGINGGQSFGFAIPVPFQSTDSLGLTHCIGAMNGCEFVIHAGNNVYVGVDRTDTVDPGSLTVGFSGYLEDAP